MAKYMNQAPREWEKQSAALRKQFTLNEWAHLPQVSAQVKYDGCQLIVNTTSRTATSRTGEDNKATQHIIDEVCSLFGPGFVVFGEAWHPDKPFAEISGLFRRHANSPDLRYVIYDIVPVDVVFGLDKSETYRERFAMIVDAMIRTSTLYCIMAQTHKLRFEDDVLAVARRQKTLGGYDGIVLRDLQSRWEQGDAKKGQAVKVKPIHSLDLRVLGSTAETRDTKLGGYLTCDLGNNMVVAVGSGLTQALLKEIALHEGRFIGQIAEVEFMGFTEDGSLREPRFKGFRTDKLKADR